MEQIRAHFEGKNSGLTALEAAMRPTREYNRTAKKKSMRPDFARFRALVYFEGQTKPKVFYSWDSVTHNGTKHQDEHEGLMKLLRFLNGETPDRVVTALIYASDEPTKQTKNKNYNIQIARFTVSTSVLHPSISFRTLVVRGRDHTVLDWKKIDINYFNKKAS